MKIIISIAATSHFKLNIAFQFFLINEGEADATGNRDYCEAAYYMKENKIDAKDAVFVGEMESVADVILHQPTKVVSIEEVSANDVTDKIVFTSPEGRARINAMGLKYEIITEFDDFPVTRLTGKFLNKATRGEEVQTKYLLRVSTPDAANPAIDVTRFHFKPLSLH